MFVKIKYLSKKIYQLRSFGNKELSYNYRISEIAAGIARVRLKRLDKENKLRSKIAKQIENKLNKTSNITILKTNEEYNSCLLQINFLLQL